MLLAGKLRRRGVVGAIHPGRLCFIKDDISGASYLVDTGSSFSILPFRSTSAPSGPLLRSAAGQPIKCWGTRVVSFSFGGRKFSWAFLLAAVEFRILGMDFLAHFDLLVDTKAGCLVPRPESTVAASPVASVAAQAADSGPVAASVVDAVDPAPVNSVSAPFLPPPRNMLANHPHLTADEAAMLESFADVLNADGRLPPSTHGVEHFIETTGRPVSSKFRRLDAAKLAAAKAEFIKLEAEGIVERADSDWASPLHMVMKADGSWRPCGDFRRLNAVTEADCYPLPNMADILATLASTAVFSKLDLKKGYHQIPVHPAHRKKTAIITPPLASLSSKCCRSH